MKDSQIRVCGRAAQTDSGAGGAVIFYSVFLLLLMGFLPVCFSAVSRRRPSRGAS